MSYIPKRPTFYAGVHKSNFEIWDELVRLVDKKGKPVLRGFVRSYAREVAPFPREKGCWYSNLEMMAKLGATSEWLMWRHEQWMIHVGIMTVSLKRQGRNTIKVRRLCSPRNTDSIIPQSEFNKQLKKKPKGGTILGGQLTVMATQ